MGLLSSLCNSKWAALNQYKSKPVKTICWSTSNVKHWSAYKTKKNLPTTRFSPYLCSQLEDTDLTNSRTTSSMCRVINIRLNKITFQCLRIQTNRSWIAFPMETKTKKIMERYGLVTLVMGSFNSSRILGFTDFHFHMSEESESSPPIEYVCAG